MSAFLTKIRQFFAVILAFLASLFGISTANGNIAFKDQTYGTDTQQAYDLYLPTGLGVNKNKVALLVYIHGGSWIACDKSCYEEDIKSVTSKGYSVAAMTLNYRFINEDGVGCEQMLDDITSAIRSAASVAKQNGYKFNKVATIGGSAGAHLALMYGYSRADECPYPISFVFDNCGPVDLTEPKFAEYLGSEAYYLCSELMDKPLNAENFSSMRDDLLAVSPISYVSSSCPPTAIMHGQQDRVVPYENALELKAALDKAGVYNVMIPFPNSGHQLDNDPDCTEKEKQLFDKFIQDYLLK